MPRSGAQSIGSVYLRDGVEKRSEKGFEQRSERGFDRSTDQKRDRKPLLGGVLGYAIHPSA
jgi:hypothetical protein